jgi:proteasome accessory factor B
MTDSAKLRRHLCLIRFLDRPFSYPTKPRLGEHLRDHDFEQVSDSTIERDLRDIRADYGITVSYDRQHRGYFLDVAKDENLDDFRAFVWLLERRERLEALTQAGPSVSRYFQFEHHDGGAASQFRGLHWLAPIWNAVQRRVVITFRYQNYADGPDEHRFVEPGLVFEYKNRWYLDGYDLNRNAPRTFGLDRISELGLTPQAIQPNREIDYRAARQHVIGVTAPPGATVERVVLRFAKPEAEYIRALPMHSSQLIVEETTEWLAIELRVVLNPELQREILAYGEHVEVLEPGALRETVAGQVAALQERYGVGGQR